MDKTRKRRFPLWGIVAGLIVGALLDGLLSSSGALTITGIAAGAMWDLLAYLFGVTGSRRGQQRDSGGDGYVGGAYFGSHDRDNGFDGNGFDGNGHNGGGFDGGSDGGGGDGGGGGGD